MKPTCGCGSSGSEGEGPQGLWGLLIAIAFAYMFVSIFLPPIDGDLLLILLIAVEIAAAVLYILANRRHRTESDRLWRELHQINDKT